MKALPFILAGLFFLSAASCGLCKKNKAENTITATQTDTTEKTGKLIVDKENPEPASADYTISSISIDGNILTIDVSFSGGCEEHFFNLYFNGNYKKVFRRK